MMGLIAAYLYLLAVATQAFGEQPLVFLPEFFLSRRESLKDEMPSAPLLTVHSDEQVTQAVERDPLEEHQEAAWEAWGTWSECSRTCGGGASYSLRRCRPRSNCRGRNIRYRSCSTEDCPAEAGDFRSQQCSAYNDVRYQSRTYQWFPASGNPSRPCALTCLAQGTGVVAVLAPKVLDGTRCYTNSLDMCISGVCTPMGCDRQLGSSALEDQCGVCKGNGTTCRLVRGQSRPQLSPDRPEDVVITVPYGSRRVKISSRGPASFVLESQSLQGIQATIHAINVSEHFTVGNSTAELVRLPDKLVLKLDGPLRTDVIIKSRFGGPGETVVHFLFYQPIGHLWKETDFFPCSVTCGGGYQLTSAECMDTRTGRTTADHYCYYHPENKKPKPRLRECSPEPCPARWDGGPWTACSSSCGGGMQSRSVACVEEDVHGAFLPVDEWKCMYVSKPSHSRPCNLFGCPKWLAQEWSPCTASCGRGLQYRVVLCLDHRGKHTGGCNPTMKPHIKEECLAPSPCYKIREKLPVEAKASWLKQAHEQDEFIQVSEEPSFSPGPWSSCSSTCGAGWRIRPILCRVLLPFSQTVTTLPDSKCLSPRPKSQQPCHIRPCPSQLPPRPNSALENLERHTNPTMFVWKQLGYKQCSVSCGGGTQQVVLSCVHKFTGLHVAEVLCPFHKPPEHASRSCNTQPCPVSWQMSAWKDCSVSCGQGLQTRHVTCPEEMSTDRHGTKPNCLGSPPNNVRACNQVDCPPAWYAQGWQECSQTCGLGKQTRQVACKQRLEDGTQQTLPRESCETLVQPISTRVCSPQACPVQWVTQAWGECSVTCGEGTHQRTLTCLRPVNSMDTISVDPLACSGLSRPANVRVCKQQNCAQPKAIKSGAVKKQPQRQKGPQILAERRAHVQSRRDRRVFLCVGGRAYVWPGSTVVIRCPVRHFPKALIRWEKDGRSLGKSTRVGQSRAGALKLRRMGLGDGGVYTCIAGPAREAVVVQLLRPVRSLMVNKHEAGSQSKGRQRKGQMPNSRFSESEGNLKTKHELYLDDGTVEKHPLRASWFPTQEVTDEPVYLRQEMQSEEHNHSYEVLIGAKPTRAQLAVIKADHPKSQSINHTAANTFKDPEPDSLPSAKIFLSEYSQGQLRDASVGRDFSKRNHFLGESSKTTSKQNFQTSPSPTRRPIDLRNSKAKFSSHPEFNITTENRNVTTFQHPTVTRPSIQASWMNMGENVWFSVGEPVLVTRHIKSLTLVCSGTGQPTSWVFWHKDGSPIMPDSRLFTLPNGSLIIHRPTERDSGMYTCRSITSTGSLSSLVTVIDESLMETTREDVTHMTFDNAEFNIGGTIKVRRGANFTLRCTVKGLPNVHRLWLKDSQKLEYHRNLSNGALLFTNITPASCGLYTCVVKTPFGQIAESTSLVLLDPPRWTKDLPGVNRVLAEHVISTKVALLVPWGGKLMACSHHDLLLGCPIEGKPKANITWSIGQPSLSFGQLSPYRLLAEGLVLQVTALKQAWKGNISCVGTNEAGSLTVSLNLNVMECVWDQQGLSACSSSCGNIGVHVPLFYCTDGTGHKLNASFCRDLPKPAERLRRCKARDCPPSWQEAPWGVCNCHTGMQRRDVSCGQRRATGLWTSLPPSRCVSIEKAPIHEVACNNDSCTRWEVSAWGQCQGRCIGWRTGVQRRQVICRSHNGSHLGRSSCSSLSRPEPQQNCSSGVCTAHWHTGPWTQCTATCGSHGFQARRVSCIHGARLRSVPEPRCAWLPRPMTWRRCNIIPCEKGGCRDTTRYCELVRRLNLCQLLMYKLRCCHSCRTRGVRLQN
uniref:ADAMTS-like 3 n=1 Tax=Eptatretus burgeri TaxID=7764 RepID=A0A8C4R3H2_EPTBU